MSPASMTCASSKRTRYRSKRARPGEFHVDLGRPRRWFLRAGARAEQQPDHRDAGGGETGAAENVTGDVQRGHVVDGRFRTAPVRAIGDERGVVRSTLEDEPGAGGHSYQPRTADYPGGPADAADRPGNPPRRRPCGRA